MQFIDWLFAPGLFRLLLALAVAVHHASKLALGASAVFIFFILSGYWISKMYAEKYVKYRYSPLVFIISRYLRLMPVLMLCILLMNLTLYVFNLQWWDEAADAVVSVDWWARSIAIVGSASQASFLMPKWSLDVEMQFYLLFPLLFYVLRKAENAFVSILGCVCAVSLISLLLTAHEKDYVFRYMGFFGAGILMYWMDYYPSRRMAWFSVGTVMVLFGVTMTVPSLQGLIIGREHVSAQAHIAFSMAVALLATPYVAHSVRTKTGQFDRHLGNLSFPFYLVHWMPQVVVGAYAGHLAPLQRLPYVALGFFCTMVVSVVIYVTYDKYFEARRRGLLCKWPRKVSSVEPAILGRVPTGFQAEPVEKCPVPK